jgi:hypothetical protein
VSAEAQQVRGGLTRDQLAGLRARPERDDLLAGIGPEYVAAIDSSTRIAWLPGTINFAIVETIHAVLGLERGAAFYRDDFAKAFKTPMFRNLVSGALRLTRSDPGGLYKFVPKASALVFRGFGAFAVGDRTPESVTIRITDVPARSFEHDAAWLRFAAASNLSILDVVGRDGHVEVQLNPDERTAAFVYQW